MGCLATLYVTRSFWDMARTALPLWQQGTVGAAMHSLLAAVALLVESVLHVMCSGFVQCMIFVLLIHGSRVPLGVLVWVSGKRRWLKTALVGASLLISMQVLVLYYLGSHTVFARGIAIRRTLYDAAAANDMQQVSALLASNHSANDGKSGWPYEFAALHEASRRGHTAVVRMLLKYGAEIEGENSFGDTALTLSSCNGETDVVRLLLDKGAHPNQRNAFGDTPLILASYHGHSDVVRTLLRYIDIDMLPLQLPNQEHAVTRTQMGTYNTHTYPHMAHFSNKKYEKSSHQQPRLQFFSTSQAKFH